MIADVRPGAIRGGLRGMVVIEHEPLAAFLRLAENPSHTQWQTNRVKKDYINAPSLISFVASSVRQIYNLAMATEESEDRKILADLFPKQGTGGGGGKRRQQYVKIAPTSDGFSVTPGRDPLKVDDQVAIRVAYADNSPGIRSALRRHTADDFQLGQRPIQYRLGGAEVIELTDNLMVVRVLNPEFNVTVTGFDRNRDIVVDADRA